MRRKNTKIRKLKNALVLSITKVKSAPLILSARSTFERLIKDDAEAFAKAGDNDLVRLEWYQSEYFTPGGTTNIRIGSSIYHFGGDGWDVRSGVDGVKGLTIANPGFRGNAERHAALGLGPFVIGIGLMVPKHKAKEAIALIEKEASLPEGQRKEFDMYRGTNCVRAHLQIFQAIGMPLGAAGCFKGFSSSWSARELWLNPPQPLVSTNLYPLSGVELTEAQLRAIFPQYMYRNYSIRADRVASALARFVICARRRSLDAADGESLRPKRTRRSRASNEKGAIT